MQISVSAPSTGYVGVAISATASWTTGTGPFIGQVAWGDGSPPDQIDYQYTKSVTKTHTYTKVGTYTITAIISDEGTGAWGSGTASIQIAAPTLSATLSASPNSGPVPLAVTFTIGASGGVTPYTGTLAYGDGITGTVPVPGTWDHMYQKVGTFTATLTVTDALGASGLSRSVTYAGVLPIPDIVSLISGLAPLIAVASVVAASELQRILPT